VLVRDPTVPSAGELVVHEHELQQTRLAQHGDGEPASCTTVTADCHASDRGLRPVAAHSMSGIEHLLVRHGAENPLAS